MSRPQYALARPGRQLNPGDPNEDPFCLSFWKGEDGAGCMPNFAKCWREAGIPHKDGWFSSPATHLFNI